MQAVLEGAMQHEKEIIKIQAGIRGFLVRKELE